MSVHASPDWSRQSQVPPLGLSEIHVWRIRLAWPDPVTSRLKKCLTAEESDRAAGFHFARHQRRFIIRRAILRQLLAAYQGGRAERVCLRPGPFGKPFIPGQDGPAGIRFSCSHSADLGLIAISRGRELGSDLEQHRELSDADDLAADCFSAAEVKELTGLPAPWKTKGFFNCWTRKEAYVKATGLGLSYPLDRFSVSLAPGRHAALLHVVDDQDAVKKWTLVSLDVSRDYSAALVFSGGNASLQLLEWHPQRFD